MKICVLGAGYVGLVSGACFSEFGWNVTCIDSNPELVEALRLGQIPIHEPGLDTLVLNNVKAGRLKFTTSQSEAVSDADLIFLAVGTPMRRGDGHADLRFIMEAVESIAPELRGYTVVATKSTVPVGTSREIETLLRKHAPDAEFDVVSNPEFLREGSALQDFMHPERVLIGADSPRAAQVMRDAYRPIRLRDAPVIVVSRESAEVAKYAANAFLAMKITFINEIADLCEKVGADVQQVAGAIGRDSRIGDKFLHPGPGYGGSCFPKDVSAFLHTGRAFDSRLTLVECVHEANTKRRRSMIDRIADAAGPLEGKTIAILGVTFKPKTDDIRDAPSLEIIPGLQARGAEIRAYDPEGMENGRRSLEQIAWCSSALEALDSADALVVLTEWNEFRALDLSAAARAMRGNIIVDLRNVFERNRAEKSGFQYFGVGR